MKLQCEHVCCSFRPVSPSVTVRGVDGASFRFSDGRTWTFDERDNLTIYNESAKPVATFARGAWSSVAVTS